MTDQLAGAGDGWIPLGAFARRLGVTRACVYGRIKRGTLDAKRANRGGYLVPWPPPDHDGSGDTAGDVARQGRDRRGDGSATVAQEVSALRVEVARLEERLAARDALGAEFRARIDRLEAALAEARRPWLAKVLEGLRRR